MLFYLLHELLEFRQMGTSKKLARASMATNPCCTCIEHRLYSSVLFIYAHKVCMTQYWPYITIGFSHMLAPTTAWNMNYPTCIYCCVLSDIHTLVKQGAMLGEVLCELINIIRLFPFPRLCVCPAVSVTVPPLPSG